ncbi:TPA: hypothetical protein P1J70_002621 [Clostridioides difficile]|nr:hypothetical protein A6J95_19340 [Clostridioides difficile]EHJ33397.1 hypothetical protein HMPREF1123_00436 [Clostridioides difficile 050-P50-2011]EHJ34343.1 hypothetical protein HMPREF1122_00320 [Clostridioides difficile 002-P50-2011]EQG15516.1 hypothetical protein QIG_3877 [Clostridioides difficile DA00065]EQG46208.1 hypothetical protein QIU_0977 [Clostridioides difficile DA00132]EQJ74576.1 hypothetical protein QSY_0932 [Clostridioides difficile P36]OFU26211.1 hypothetical protein HMPREF
MGGNLLANRSKFEEVQKTLTKKGKKFNVGIGKDEKGYFAYTHRARSKSYISKQDIPIKVLKFIESTG